MQEREYTSRRGETRREAVMEDAADITPEVLEAGFSVVDGWFMDEPIDWETVLDRTEGYLQGKGPDGRDLVFGEDLLSPAIRKFQRELRRMKKEALA